MRWAGLLFLLASPAIADTALIAFEFETESILAAGGDIEFAEQTFDLGGGPALSVRLNRNFDARFVDVTKKNIGKVMTLWICGEMIVEPVLMGPLSRAEFIVTVASVEEATHLAAMLKADSCPDQTLG